MARRRFELTDDQFEQIEDLFPEFDRASVNWIRTARNPRTAPIYERGYLEKVVPYDLAEEVAEGVVQALATEAAHGQTYHVGGRQTYTFVEITDIIARGMGLSTDQLRACAVIADPGAMSKRFLSRTPGIAVRRARGEA